MIGSIEHLFTQEGTSTQDLLYTQRHKIIGAMLFIALLSFELFNFDTTKYALGDLIGGVSFLTISWSTILALAFCSIDFAGLLHILLPQSGVQPMARWYMVGAWFFGAFLNTIMTWYSVTLTLLDHPIGNEVLSREVLLTAVPLLVAILVLLTRVLFIGAVSTMMTKRFSADKKATRNAILRPTNASQTQYHHHTIRRQKEAMAQQRP